MKYGLCAYKWVICRAIAIRSIFFTKLNPTAAIRGFLVIFGMGFAARPVGAFRLSILDDL